MFLFLLILTLPAVLVTAHPWWPETQTTRQPQAPHQTQAPHQPSSPAPNRPASGGGTYTGHMTHYDPALGACGITSTGSDYVVSISHISFDASSTGSNPNQNPICFKKIRVFDGSNTADATVVDRCVWCGVDDIEVSNAVFTQVAGDLGIGNTTVTWSWL